MKKPLLYLLSLTCMGLFGQGVPYGLEFRINEYHADWQQNQQIVPLINGGFAACWGSYNQDGSGLEIYAQVFGSNGERIGDEFHANSTTPGNQDYPQIASLTGGGFVICWPSFHEDDLGCRINAYGQIFSADGIKVDAEFPIGDESEIYRCSPRLASLQDDGFVICWSVENADGSSGGLFGRIFSTNPAWIYREFRINPDTAVLPYIRHVAALSGGGFVACWTDEAPDAETRGFYGQVFSADGIETGHGFKIAEEKPFVSNLQILAIRNGGFVIYWTSYSDGGSYIGENSRVYSSDGTMLSSEFLQEAKPSRCAATLQNGNFVIVRIDWNGEVYYRLYSPSGERIGDRISVHSCADGLHEWPQIASTASGDLIVCWTSANSGHADSDTLFGQRLSPDGAKTGGEFQIIPQREGRPSGGLHSGFQIVSDPKGGYVFCWQGSINTEYWDPDILGMRFPESPLIHVLLPFRLLEPSNDVSIHSVDASLKWRQPSSLIVCYPWELQYQIRIDDNPDFISPRIVKQDRDTTMLIQNLRLGTTYFWKVLAENIAGDSLWSTNTNAFFVSHDATSGVEKGQTTGFHEFTLRPNYPNPFNPSTTFRFDLPRPGFVDFSIYDITGKPVKALVHELRPAGSHSVKWDGTDSSGNPAPSGIYVCRMEARSADGRHFMKTMKIGLVR